MDKIGIRELTAHAPEIVRQVREERVRYTVTYRRRTVGLLVPMPVERASTDDDDVLWREQELGHQIGRGWKSAKTGTELVSEMRR